MWSISDLRPMSRSTSSAGAGLGAEAEQLPRNRHLTIRNPRAAHKDKRRLLIGRTDGGRPLTLVIERTAEPTTWLIVTGWSSTEAERKILEVTR